MSAAGDELAALRADVAHADRRMAELLEVVLAVAARDYTRRADTSDRNDVYDALALGLNMITEELQARAGLIQNTLQAMADALVIGDASGMIVMVNAAAERMLGRNETFLRRELISTLFGGDAAGLTPRELVRRFGGHGGEATCVTRDRLQIPVSLTAAAIEAGGELTGIVCVARDISEHRRAEAERRHLEATVQAMSTPLIPLGDGVVVMPLVGTLDEARAGQVIETMLAGISEHRAAVVILDITGVVTLDAAVAAALTRSVRAAALLGARAVLTGIRPAVAAALVALDADTHGLDTRGTLRDGLALATALLRRR